MENAAIFLTLCLWACISACIVFPPVVVFSFIQSRKRARLRAAIMDELRRGLGAENVIEANYTTEAHYRAGHRGPWWRPSQVCDATGLLLADAQKLQFVGLDCETAERIQLEMDPADTSLHDIGRHIFTKRGVRGGVSWIEVVSGQQRHYFTPDTGTLTLGSRRKAREILRELESLYGKAG